MIENTGYILEHCRQNCTKSAQDWKEFYHDLKNILEELDLPKHLNRIFQQIHYHHIPKIALAGCPNGCSQPQIKDIGISGYLRPKITNELCSGCKACIDSCLENALNWKGEEAELNYNFCLECGDCIRACPTGRIASEEAGWLIHLGGRLGRHPQLGKISGREKSNTEVIIRLEAILKDYLENALPGERLNHFLQRQT